MILGRVTDMYGRTYRKNLDGTYDKRFKFGYEVEKRSKSATVAVAKVIKQLVEKDKASDLLVKSNAYIWKVAIFTGFLASFTRMLVNLAR